MSARRAVAEPVDERPHALRLVVVTLAFGAITLLIASPRTGLYWYIFPLFGIGACYLFQFRRELPARWIVTFACTTVVSAVALALDWPFSGHVLWNVLFIGHALMNGRQRRQWLVILGASLVYLFAMKVASQTTRDVVGGFISIGVAVVALLVLSLLVTSHQRPT